MAGARRRSEQAPETWTPPTTGDLRSPFHYLFWLARSQPRRIALGATFGSCWMVGLAVPPWVLSRAVDEGLVAGDLTTLVRWALVLLVVGLLTAALSIARHRTMTKIRMDASFRSIRATVWHTSRLGASLSRRVRAGEVVTIGVADVNTVAQAMTVTGPGVGAVLAYAVVAALLFTTSPLLAAVVLAGVPLLAVAVGPILHRIQRSGDEYRKHQGTLTMRLVDVLAGLRVVNGLGGKANVAERYGEQSQALVTRGYRVAGPTSWLGALATGLPALFLAAVVWLSARMAAVGTITVGDVVAVYGYVAVLVVPVAALIEGGGDLARARVAGQRIVDLLNLPVAHHDDPDPVNLPVGGGPLADPLSGVVVRPGLFTALVADRPADAQGVLTRLGRVAAAEGTGVLWAGVSIDEVTRAEFRSRLVVAENDAEVFTGTVREIVAGRAEPDDDRIRTALRTAVAADVVEALPGGLDATVAAGGSDLSGGQRQRIRLARAAHTAADVLLADDPTSAVDANTEAAMIDRLRAARRDTTTVVTTTSPLVLDRADEVVVLIDGRVVATGTHRDLLRSDQDYRALVSRAWDESVSRAGDERAGDDRAGDDRAGDEEVAP